MQATKVNDTFNSTTTTHEKAFALESGKSFIDNKQKDAELLLKRLEQLPDANKKTTAFRTATRKFGQSLPIHSPDDWRPLSRQVLKKCCTVLDQIEPSHIERSMHRNQLLQSAIFQRQNLMQPRDLYHVECIYPNTPSLRCSPSSKLGHQQLSRCIAAEGRGVWQKIIDVDSLPEAKQAYYYNLSTEVAQAAEPFDWLNNKNKSILKREIW